MFCISTCAVARDRRTKVGILRRLSSIRATSAVSIAVSVPAAPIAKPMSARAKAGASLMPSPTMPTLPLRASCSTSRNLSSGSRLPCARSIPACAAMACAVWGLSPVSIMVLMPSACSSAMAVLLLSLMVSATANKACTAFAPTNITTVLPAVSSAAMRCSSSGVHCPSSSSIRWLPRW